MWAMFCVCVCVYFKPNSVYTTISKCHVSRSCTILNHLVLPFFFLCFNFLNLIFIFINATCIYFKESNISIRIVSIFLKNASPSFFFWPEAISFKSLNIIFCFSLYTEARCLLILPVFSLAFGLHYGRWRSSSLPTLLFFVPLPCTYTFSLPYSSAVDIS